MKNIQVSVLGNTLAPQPVADTLMIRPLEQVAAFEVEATLGRPLNHQPATVYPALLSGRLEESQILARLGHMVFPARLLLASVVMVGVMRGRRRRTPGGKVAQEFRLVHLIGVELLQKMLYVGFGDRFRNDHGPRRVGQIRLFDFIEIHQRLHQLVKRARLFRVDVSQILLRLRFFKLYFAFVLTGQAISLHKQKMK